MNKQKFNIFYIPAEVYDIGIFFIFSKDTQRVLKYVNDKQKTKYIVEDLDSKGIIFRKTGYCCIIWMPEFPRTIDQEGTLNHEILHGVKAILYNWAGMELTDSSEEAYAHLHAYILRQVLKKIKQIKTKKKK